MKPLKRHQQTPSGTGSSSSVVNSCTFHMEVNCLSLWFIGELLLPMTTETSLVPSPVDDSELDLDSEALATAE